MLTRWPALTAARHVSAPRQTVWVCQSGPMQRAGSVAVADGAALAAWPGLCEPHADGWCLHLPADVAAASAALASLNRALHAGGRIRAWREEPYPLLAESGTLLAVIERASARFWGALTFGAHCNGYVVGADGRPSHLWVARRSDTKPTDPGKLDNLIGCGVPHGQTPRQALIREAWEEAGLQSAQLTGLQAGRVLNIACDIREGWQHEWLYAYDLALPSGLLPVNQDGEVAEHRLWPIDQALAFAAEGRMTMDASLATLDFALRHALLPADEAAELAPRLAALCVTPEAARRFDPPIV
ncbi:NUDIX hydrolase [Vitreoscilla filiformis]|uniref:NUDIX hydrolase n=1 Tax=Vitreoscilla filiformis TaxID=63 RepID=A0A221KDG7_VITFI|nr:NUDIX domain-containing protein [Vitreoscilla filiformis]ASM77084.1 NUDIX hydrolase [Vitreoscilla filiformis]